MCVSASAREGECEEATLTSSAKVSKGEILVHFNEIFDALSKVRPVASM
jgi:hypothetical protein